MVEETRGWLGSFSLNITSPIFFYTKRCVHHALVRCNASRQITHLLCGCELSLIISRDKREQLVHHRVSKIIWFKSVELIDALFCVL